MVESYMKFIFNDENNQLHLKTNTNLKDLNKRMSVIIERNYSRLERVNPERSLVYKIITTNNM